jgi:hypothetical protein
MEDFADFGGVTASEALTLLTEFDRQFPGRLFGSADRLTNGSIDTGVTGDDFSFQDYDFQEGVIVSIFASALMVNYLTIQI